MQKMQKIMSFTSIIFEYISTFTFPPLSILILSAPSKHPP